MPREPERAALALTEGRFRDRAPTERCFPFFPFFKLPPLYLYVTLTRKVETFKPLREGHFQLQIVPKRTSESNEF
jgi:hypothetical protein